MRLMQRTRNKDSEKMFRAAEDYETSGDLENAFNRLLEAARLGHAPSQISLGNFYSSGKGTTVDKTEAAWWYREAYKNGYRDGALNLAIDRKNEGRIRSAVIWFKKAIAMHDGEACVQLAKLYLTNKRYQARARELLRNATSMKPSDISDYAKEEAERLLEAYKMPH